MNCFISGSSLSPSRTLQLLLHIITRNINHDLNTFHNLNTFHYEFLIQVIHTGIGSTRRFYSNWYRKIIKMKKL